MGLEIMNSENELKKDKVDVTFKISKNLSKTEKDNIIYDIINEINDRMLYVTEVKINNETMFAFDDNKFSKEVQ